MLVSMNDLILSFVLKNTKTLTPNDLPNYKIRMGREVKSLDHYVLNAKNIGFNDITDMLQTEFKHLPMEVSQTTHTPEGRNISTNYLWSHRVGENSQDFDSKTYQGGGTGLQTFVWPSYQCKKTSGDGNIPKNINLGNFNLYSESDLQTVANNFRELLTYSGNVAVSYKGIVKHNELDFVFGENQYVIDKIVYDLGKNSTTFECRAELT